MRFAARLARIKATVYPDEAQADIDWLVRQLERVKSAKIIQLNGYLETSYVEARRSAEADDVLPGQMALFGSGATPGDGNRAG